MSKYNQRGSVILSLKHIILFVFAGILPALPAWAATNNDFQEWTLLFVNHQLDGDWSASMQVENRLREDASEIDKKIFNPADF